MALEAEVAGLDDAGVHRPHGHLVDAPRPRRGRRDRPSRGQRGAPAGLGRDAGAGASARGARRDDAVHLDRARARRPAPAGSSGVRDGYERPRAPGRAAKPVRPNRRRQHGHEFAGGATASAAGNARSAASRPPASQDSMQVCRNGVDGHTGTSARAAGIRCAPWRRGRPSLPRPGRRICVRALPCLASDPCGRLQEQRGHERREPGAHHQRSEGHGGRGHEPEDRLRRPVALELPCSMGRTRSPCRERRATGRRAAARPAARVRPRGPPAGSRARSRRVRRAARHPPRTGAPPAGRQCRAAGAARPAPRPPGWCRTRPAGCRSGRRAPPCRASGSPRAAARRRSPPRPRPMPTAMMPMFSTLE